jgi:hypothetical protein
MKILHLKDKKKKKKKKKKKRGMPEVGQTKD